MNDEKELKKIGSLIKAKRLELGLSQSELAEKLGYSSKSTLSLIENGKRDIPTPQLKKLANILNTSVEYLLGYNITIEIDDKEKYEKIKRELFAFYEKLNEENKTNAKGYMKFLLDNQKK